MAQYPTRDAERDGRERVQAPRQASHQEPRFPCARIASVQEDSPAFDAGFEPGCSLTSVNGRPIRDIIDWRWLSAADEIEVGYIDLDGDVGTVALWRDAGEDWGFVFDGLVFDGVRQCRNACTFCFMHQLPRGLRPSLYVRDDDFRLSFLVGTFVTMTNMTAEDEARVLEQRISPLRVSLQVVNPQVRRSMMGGHAQHGVDVLERLLAAGVQVHAQVVLVPGVNDGDVLRETLSWAYARPGILDVGIVPLGFTRHQGRFDRSFNDPAAAREVLRLVGTFQEHAQAQRGRPWVFAADEFYRNAYGSGVLDHIPPVQHYGDFSLFEDGIGIMRSTVEDWRAAVRDGTVGRCRRILQEADVTARIVAGCALRELFDALVAESGIADVFTPLYVENEFFGGNVDVTGLLTASDVVPAVRRAAIDGHARFFVLDVIFNDDGLTLDDFTLHDMEMATASRIGVVSCTPTEFFAQIAESVRVAR